MKDNRLYKHSCKPMKKRGEEKGRIMKNKIKTNMESFLVSQVFFKKVIIIKRIFTQRILSIGI